MMLAWLRLTQGSITLMDLAKRLEVKTAGERCCFLIGGDRPRGRRARWCGRDTPRIEMTKTKKARKSTGAQVARSRVMGTRGLKVIAIAVNASTPTSQPLPLASFSGDRHPQSTPR
jgi:hypothetical protein